MYIAIACVGYSFICCYCCNELLEGLLLAYGGEIQGCFASVTLHTMAKQ